MQNKLQKNEVPIKVFRYSLFTFLFVQSLVFWPWAKIAFEIPKVWFVNRYIEVLGILTLVLFPYFTTKKNSGKVDSKILFLVFAFLIAAFISSIFGENFSKSFWGNYYRSDGLYTLIHLVIFYLIVTTTFRNEWLEKGLTIIGVSSLFLSFLSVIFYVAQNLINIKIPYIIDWYGAVGGPFGNPNFLAGYLVVTLPFVFFLASLHKNKLLKLTPIFQITAILLTQAWAGILGMACLFIIFLFFQKKNLLATVLLLLSIIPGVVFYKNSPSLNYDHSQVAESRERIFRKGITAFSERPAIGWGWANFDFAFDSVVWPIRLERDVYVDKAHSHFLEILVTTGSLGLAIYLCLLIKSFLNLKRLKSSSRKYLLASLVLFVIHSQTNVISISEELIFWLLLGVSTKRLGS